MDNTLNLALNWAQTDDVALATVISTWGSAPRPVGSIMIIKSGGLFEGSVSGGCIEGEVIHAALSVIKTGKQQVLEFGVSNDDAINVGLACGGTIKILLVKIDPKMLDQLKSIKSSLDQQQSIIWLRPVVEGKEAKLVSDTDKTKHSDEEFFSHRFETPIKLKIIGAVHIAQALNTMAKLNGFDVEIIDPRGAFAEAERMQDCVVIERWPDEELNQHQPNNRTAIVTLTHDPKLDDAALKVALKSDAFYIGCLGSKKTHAKRLERLADLGFTSQQLERIHGPVGLDIGAKSVSEIAISILAEIVSVYRDQK